MRCGADQRRQLEHLCRTIARPAIANERLKRNRAGQVVLQLKSAYQDGTTHIVMSPLEFLQRLAALVPRPRLPLIRFHGVLAPHAKLRAAIVPSPVDDAPEQASDRTHAQPSPARLSWARLLKRVFQIDVERCPACGGTLKIIAAIVEPPVIVRILAHLGLPTRAPRVRPRAASISSKRPEPKPKPDPSRSAPAPMPALSRRSHKRPKRREISPRRRINGFKNPRHGASFHPPHG